MLPNQTVGRYQIIREIDRGGMATVYLAYDTKMAREVALKILPKQFSYNKTFLLRFHNEARALAKLEHFAIVPIYDFGEEDGFPFLAMRYMSQGSLTQQLANGPLPIPLIARVLHRVAEALAKAHSQDIVHRDIKPSNILFDGEGNAYLSDFGIAKVHEPQQNLTTEAVLGTPAYMSPEQVDGGEYVDGRSDIYSLGIVLFEMMTGQIPYPAEQSHVQQMMAHILTPTPSILSVRPELPEAFAPIVAKAMDKNRDNRYATARALAEDFLKTAVLTRRISPLNEDSWPGLATAHSLPVHLQQELASDEAQVRAGAARKLEALLYAPDSNLLIPALMALAKLTRDQDSHVARRATTHLDNFYEETPQTAVASPHTAASTRLASGATRDSRETWSQKVLRFIRQPVTLESGWGSAVVILFLSVLVLVLLYAVFKPIEEKTETSVASPGSTRDVAGLRMAQTGSALTSDASLAQSTLVAKQGTRTATTATAVARQQQHATATARAQSQATGTATAMRSQINTILAQAQPNQYVVGDHQLAHQEDNFVATYLDETIYLQDFVAEAEFFNPFGTNLHDWDIGFFFRHDPDDNHRQWRIIVSTDGDRSGYWNLDFFYNNEPVAAYAMNGRLDYGVLDTSVGGHNQLTLIAQGRTGYLLVNGYAISQLNFAYNNDGPGYIQTGTGFFSGHETSGYHTDVKNFVVRSTNPADIRQIQQKVTATAVANAATATRVAGQSAARNLLQTADSLSVYFEETGALDHQDDDLIEADTAGVNLKNFIAEAIFSNPYSSGAGSWDYGFIFRHDAETLDSYHLVILSSNRWILYLRQNGVQTTIDEGNLGNLDTTAYGRNKITLIVKDSQGYFYLNDQYVTNLNLFDRASAGEVALATGFYNGDEIPGEQTDFHNFGVWPLN